MRDISNLIAAVTLESAIAASAVQALLATQQHLQDAQAQVSLLQQQAAANSLDADQVTKLLDTVSTTTAQLSAAIPANAAPDGSASVAGAALAPAVAGTDAVAQARDAAAAPAVPVLDAAPHAAPGAYAQPTDTAAAGPGPIVQP